MNIGIVVYSQTGNTLSIAQRLKDRLEADGHSVALERLAVVGELQRGSTDIRFEKLPATNLYDALVFASPVEAFSLSPVMKGYFKQVGSFANKRVALMVTEYLPWPWLGGNQAVGYLKKACAVRDAVVCGSGVVNWSNRRREQQAAELVGRLGGAFSTRTDG